MSLLLKIRVIEFSKSISGKVITSKFPTNTPRAFHTETTWIIKGHYSGEFPPEGFSKASVTRITIKTKYKQANKHRKQYDTTKY